LTQSVLRSGDVAGTAQRKAT